MEIKYIYFEVVRKPDNEPTIRNENILLNKMEYTNQNGICGFTFIAHYSHDEQRYFVDQTWVDIEKYNNRDKSGIKNCRWGELQDKMIEQALNKLKNSL